MLRLNKNIIINMLILLLVLTMVGCSSSKPQTAPSTTAAPASVAAVKGLTSAIAEQPTVLTSVGQSADVEMVKALMDNAKLNYTMNKVVTGKELGDAKTLILAVGGSSKGLGAAGINAEDELKRTTELVEAAKKNGLKIIALHIGGENRRGELSDKFIEPSCKDADYIIVVKDGNKDEAFTKIATSKNIPIDSVASIADVMEPLKKAFK